MEMSLDVSAASSSYLVTSVLCLSLTTTGQTTRLYQSKRCTIPVSKPPLSFQARGEIFTQWNWEREWWRIVEQQQLPCLGKNLESQAAVLGSGTVLSGAGPELNWAHRNPGQQSQQCPRNTRLSWNWCCLTVSLLHLNITYFRNPSCRPATPVCCYSIHISSYIT